MRGAIEKRLEALEQSNGNDDALPVIVDDGTSDAELEELRRKHGPRVERWSDAVNWFV